MENLVGTDKRPVFYIQPEMLFNKDCTIMWAQISENGLWIEFYSKELVKEFEFPIISAHSLQKSWLENKYE